MIQQSDTPSPQIYHFWIIQKSSGLTIFSQQFRKNALQSDEDIIGGLLMAMIGFTQEAVGQSIDVIQMSDSRFLFSMKSDFVMVVLASNAMESDRIRILLDLIQQKFHEQYREILTEKKLNKLSLFKGFGSVTEEIFQAETQYLTIIKSRAKKVEEYMKSVQPQWKTFHEIIIEQTTARNKWCGLEKFTLNKGIERDLAEVRSKRKSSVIQGISERQPEIGRWIKP
jgi:hypothetical protein